MGYSRVYESEISLSWEIFFFKHIQDTMQSGVFLLSLEAVYNTNKYVGTLRDTFDWKFVEYGDFDILTKQQWTTKKSVK